MNVMEQHKLCRLCGTIIKTRSGFPVKLNSKINYCSIICSSRARWGVGKSGICKRCGKVTRLRTSYEKKGFCTRVCYEESVGGFIKRNKSINLNCENCGKDYNPRWYKLTKFCSPQCAAIFREKRNNSIKQQVIITCLWCKKQRKSTDRDQKFCNGTCSLKYLADKRIGTKRPYEERLLISKRKMGVNNPSWRGGVTVGRIKLINTIEYKDWRRAVFERDNYTCVECFKRGSVLNADHIVPWWQNKTLRFKVSNGQTLCESCHKKKTIKELKAGWINQYTSSKKQTHINNAKLRKKVGV